MDPQGRQLAALQGHHAALSLHPQPDFAERYQVQLDRYDATSVAAELY
jgi:hypothetical protein